MSTNISIEINLAIQYFQNGNLDEAKKILQKALNVYPKNIAVLEILAIIFVNLRELSQALILFEEITKIKPEYVEGWTNRGNVLFELKEYEQALTSYIKAIELKPDCGKTLNNFGTTLFELRRYEQALSAYDNVIGLEPENVEAWFNRGNTLLKLKQYEQALSAYDKAISINPNYPDAWTNRGNAFLELKQYEQALISFDKAITINPNYPDAWSNRADALTELQEYQQALSSYDKAIKIYPDFVEAWYNRGNALAEMRKYDEAIASFDKAISINSKDAASWCNRGNILVSIGKYELGERSIRRSIEIDDNLIEARSCLLFNLNYFSRQSIEANLLEARLFGRKVSNRSEPKFDKWNTSISNGKLRIGFVSGDLRNHPVGYFMESFLEKIDPTNFDLFAFTNSIDDDLSKRIKHHFIEWVPIYSLSDFDAAGQIHQRQIQILIDLSGHTKNNRLPVFAYKPAPLQISWLGYFATTGLPEIDYFLGDPHMLPISEIKHFTENVWRLAETWFCLSPPNFQITVSDLPARKNGYVTFGSFGNLAKMNDEVVRVWDLTLLDDVRKRFEKFEVKSDRLILEGPESREKYFESYSRVDFVLDTFPYPGGTTSIDALWMGVPVLTLKGDRFLSHLGESIAINSGIPDWIASDEDEYIRKAIKFSMDIESLAKQRKSLRDRVRHSPLMDNTRFAKNFVDALLGMWSQRFTS
jgi:protein O-GlcNAc transferase